MRIQTQRETLDCPSYMMRFDEWIVHVTVARNQSFNRLASWHLPTTFGHGNQDAVSVCNIHRRFDWDWFTVYDMHGLNLFSTLTFGRQGSRFDVVWRGLCHVPAS